MYHAQIIFFCYTKNGQWPTELDIEVMMDITKQVWTMIYKSRFNDERRLLAEVA